MNKVVVVAGLAGLLAAGGAVYWHNLPPKLPIEQEYVLKPDPHGMDCKSDETMTACANEFGGRLDGLDYQTLAFVNNDNGQAIYVVGKFKRSQYEDGFEAFVDRYGQPDDRLGDPGDQRSIWFLKNGVAVMRERAAKIGEGSAAFSLFCFDGGNERVTKELKADCKKLFKPAAI